MPEGQEKFGTAGQRSSICSGCCRAGIADESVDLVISNCVVNLSPDKRRVIREAYRVLRPGGEMHFSDVYADRRVPAALQTDEVRCRPPNCMLRTPAFGAGHWHKFCQLSGSSNVHALSICTMLCLWPPHSSPLACSFWRITSEGAMQPIHSVHLYSAPGLQVMWGECIAGALYINDFLRIAKEAGFADPRILHQGPVAINDPDIQVPCSRKGACDCAMALCHTICSPPRLHLLAKSQLMSRPAAQHRVSFRV